MDFLSFFGLKEDPFKLTPDPAYFYPSASHNEGLLLMDYSIDQKEGFVLVIGDPGTGKTTLLKVLLEKWKDRAETAMVLTPRLSPEEFLISVVEDLNIKPGRKNKNELIKALRDFMAQKSLEGKRVIIIVDEAQNLPDETLEELRLLSNLETDKDKLIQIILLGQPELEPKLMSDRLRQLNQRITTRVRLRHFSLEETIDYINFRLIKAGKQNIQVHRKAGRLAHRLSGGVPRLINMLISRSLMAAYLEESNVIVPRHISNAVKSLDHSDMKLKNRPGPAQLAAVFVLTVLSVIIIMNFPLHRKTSVVPEQPVRTAELNPVQKQVETVSAPPVSGAAPLPEREINLPARQPAAPPAEANIPVHKIVSVKVDVANVREKPSFDSLKVGASHKGIQMIVLQEHVDGENLTWYQIAFEGEKRWISEEVVDVMDVGETGGR
ncbi:MAG: AAA family ATPase [Nitrospirae bacterium]|nr:AAA family ATPase [Nitrospirota bacterium]